MPRPAPKRTRTAKASKPGNFPESQTDNESNPVPSVEQGSVDPRRALRNQTPLKNNEQAIGSSPTGDRPDIGSQPGTGSRPPTRSRGYSSTLYFANRQGDIGSRIPGTPGFDSSVLSNFRRRPRQQSILHNLQGEDGSSELDDDDFLGGLSPEDESTPLNLPGRKSLLKRQTDESPLSSPSKSVSTPSTGSSRKRKHSEAVQVPASSFEPGQDMVEGSPSRTSVARDSPSRTPVAHDSPSHQSHISASPQTTQLSELLSQTMALPASSPFSTQTPSTAPAQSPIAASRRTLAGKKSKQPSHLSTATLQDQLLPRRRSRRTKRPSGDEFDFPSDDDGMHNAAPGDEDELSYLPSRRSKPKPLSNTREKSKLNNKNQKSKVKAKAKPVKAPESQPVTYSRTRPRGDIDKENEIHLSSPSSSPLSTPPSSEVSDAETETTETPGSGSKRRYVSAELRAAAQKFAEVDKWQMEFEELNSSEVSAAEI
ncbi:hypothetical protein N7495_008852 [Penicillium taxi]|uniref:uncharacterized protein n=1 Tax=Penicillium taxi TaxID=168475 RepID=UPI002544F404|nr:uncharacterized protein N7495_008852 [Penicillium taxi]KAJ5888811.1 hypothetical protein N7495_008852 [Penicillium taxi]